MEFLNVKYLANIEQKYKDWMLDYYSEQTFILL